MVVSAQNFINGWSPAFSSTANRLEVRDIRQGGNDLLTTVPLAAQAMWGGVVLSNVAAVTTGPIRLIANLFRYAFHPLISAPVSVLSSVVKDNFYESSVTARLEAQTKYYEAVAVDPNASSVPATVTLNLEGTPRHFLLGRDVTYKMNNSIEVDVNGKKELHVFTPLLPHDQLDENCREIERNGQRIRVKLLYKIDEKDLTNVQLTINGENRFYRIENEISEPSPGAIVFGDIWQGATCYRIGNELPQPVPGCITIQTAERQLNYDTGLEILSPTSTSRTFLINGKARHFSSAKFVLSPSWGLSGSINLIPKLPVKLPTRLSYTTTQVLRFINRHFSNIIRVAILASGIALAILGHGFMAAGTLFAVVYEYLERDLGIVPRKISLFMEERMPILSALGLLLVGSFTSKLLAAGSLVFTIPSLKQWTHHKIDQLLKSPIGLVMKTVAIKVGKMSSAEAVKLEKTLRDFPLLKEADAPLVEKRAMSFAEINHILTGQADAYTINPAHLTKNFEPTLQLPENHNFSELNRLWNSFGNHWMQPNTAKRLSERLADDKRFILFLKKKFPEANRFYFQNPLHLSGEARAQEYNRQKTAHKEQVDSWILQLAQEQGTSSQQWIANWTKEQLGHFVAKLSLQRPSEGEHRLLNEAIQNVAQIIPFLLNPNTSNIDREDALIKLAIEGGDYCNLAAKRASGEVKEGFIRPLLDQAEPNPRKAFENQVRLTLQNERLRLLQAGFQEAAQLFSQREETQDTAQDIHLYTALSNSLKRGMYPLPKEEMDSYDLTDLLLKSTALRPLQQALLEEYQRRFEPVMREMGIVRGNLRVNKILDYLRNAVQENPSLSEAEKNQLLTGALSNDNEHLADPSNYPKWHRLMLVILGVWKERESQPAN